MHRSRRRKPAPRRQSSTSAHEAACWIVHPVAVARRPAVWRCSSATKMSSEERSVLGFTEDFANKIAANYRRRHRDRTVPVPAPGWPPILEHDREKPVARMERSAIRDSRCGLRCRDYAPLHPGYGRSFLRLCREQLVARMSKRNPDSCRDPRCPGLRCAPSGLRRLQCPLTLTVANSS